MILNSPGGSVVAGQSLAATIRQSHLSVFVGDSGVCASACFILFAAGAPRMYEPGARIGVHSAIGGGFETTDAMAMTTAMARTVAELGVPDAIVGRMITTAPGSMAWLSEADLKSMGAVRFGDVKPPGPSAPSVATQPSSPRPPAPAAPNAVATATVVPPALTPPSRFGPVSADTASASFQHGLADRTAWEGWFTALSGDFHDGAEFWTAERSKVRPRPCTAPAADWTRGCLEAKRLLTASDALRQTDAQYWWGWNSYAAR